MVYIMSKKYNIIVLDPPWSYRDNKSNNPKLGGKKYPLMTVDDLKKIRFDDILAEDCYLFMWCVNPLLPHAFELVNYPSLKVRAC